MNWIKRALRGWLFPEYDGVCKHMETMERARMELRKVSGHVTIKEPVIIVGSLNHCQVHYRPTIKPRIVLTEVAAMLSLSGDNQRVSDNIFTAEPAGGD